MGQTVFHIGLPKTATTTLQSVMMRHPQVHYLGKTLRDTMKPSDSLEIARAILFMDEARFRAALPALADRLGELKAGAACVFISDEAFTLAEFMMIGRGWGRQTVTDHEVIAERMHRLDPDAGIHVTVREQVSFLKSYYNQHVRIGMIDGDFDSLIANELKHLPHRSLLNLLRYDELHAAYGARFGADNLLVELFEDSARAFGPYLDRVSAFCGVSPERARALWAGARKNTSSRFVLRPGARLVKDRAPGLFRLLPRPGRNALTRALLTRPVPPARLDPARLAELRAVFAPSNARFGARLGLDLRERGYAWPA